MSDRINQAVMSIDLVAEGGISAGRCLEMIQSVDGEKGFCQTQCEKAFGNAKDDS